MAQKIILKSTLQVRLKSSDEKKKKKKENEKKKSILEDMVFQLMQNCMKQTLDVAIDEILKSWK